MTPYDQLLEWASERGEGGWDAFKNVCEYVNIGRPNQAARCLSALAHLEFDWARGRFACCPPTAVLTLRSSGCVIVTGQRRRGSRQRLEALYADYEADLDIDLRTPLDARSVDVVHPLANIDTAAADSRAPGLVCDVFNLNRRPGAIYSEAWFIRAFLRRVSRPLLRALRWLPGCA